MIDASGQRPSGFIWGNNFMLGSRRACDFIQIDPQDIVFSNRIKRHSNTTELITARPDFETTFAVVYARHTSKYQLDIKTLDMVR